MHRTPVLETILKAMEEVVYFQEKAKTQILFLIGRSPTLLPVDSMSPLPSKNAKPTASGERRSHLFRFSRDTYSSELAIDCGVLGFRLEGCLFRSVLVNTPHACGQVASSHA